MNTLLDTVANSLADQRKKDSAEYRRLLLANNPADAAKLKKIMSDRSITPTQAADDQRILRQATNLEAQADAFTPEMGEQHEAAWGTLKRHDEESETLARDREAERRRLAVEAELLTTRRDTARDAGRRLEQLRQEHRDLFGLPAREPEAEPDLVSHGFAILPSPPESEREKASRRPVPFAPYSEVIA